jgi:hypothetical protein
MKPIWTLRQLLAWLRGLTIMVALFWALVLIQLVSALVTGGFSGLRGQFVRVATAGVPPEEQNIAVRKMYEALGVTAIAGCVLYKAQRSWDEKYTPIARPGTAHNASFSLGPLCSRW